jgi:hypothetical protein
MGQAGVPFSEVSRRASVRMRRTAEQTQAKGLYPQPPSRSRGPAKTMAARREALLPQAEADVSFAQVCVGRPPPPYSRQEFSQLWAALSFAEGGGR